MERAIDNEVVKRLLNKETITETELPILARALILEAIHKYISDELDCNEDDVEKAFCSDAQLMSGKDFDRLTRKVAGWLKRELWTLCDSSWNEEKGCAMYTLEDASALDIKKDASPEEILDVLRDKTLDTVFFFLLDNMAFSD